MLASQIKKKNLNSFFMFYLLYILTRRLNLFLQRKNNFIHITFRPMFGNQRFYNVRLAGLSKEVNIIILIN